MGLNRTVRWRPLGAVGLEHLEIAESPLGILARSVLIGGDARAPFGLHYEVELAPNWSFRTLRLERADGPRLELHSDGEGNWTDGQHLQLPELDGCIDIDISGTPFTNTLPIRRNRFTPGEPARFTMARIPLDTLEPVADEQTYTLLDDGRYLYESSDGSFSARLEFDADGLVTYYPALFERV